MNPLSQFARDSPSSMPVVLVLLLIAFPFHSQKHPGLDDKLYSHHYRPRKICVGYFPSHNPDPMHTSALSLGFLLSSPGEIHGSWQTVLPDKTVHLLSLAGVAEPHASSQGDGCPHTSEGGPQLQACLTHRRQTLTQKGMFP